jgi:chemotaxis methyl-accepting protein methylase
MDEGSFNQILVYFNLSPRGYRKVRKGAKKRLSRHMRALGCTRVGDYIDTVSRWPAIEEECRLCLTVPISRFFRDKRLWHHLENTALPRVIASAGDTFRVWSCGCARGEEAYSFSILWHRLGLTLVRLPALALWATDCNADYLLMAKKGRYGISSLKELPREAIDRYFVKEPGEQQYVLRPFLKTGIRFDRHDITRDPPPSGRFEVVMIRNNLLTYYRPPEREKALEMVRRALVPGGMLIIGSHERLPAGFDGLKTLAEHPWIRYNPRVVEKSGPPHQRPDTVHETHTAPATDAFTGREFSPRRVGQ